MFSAVRKPEIGTSPNFFERFLPFFLALILPWVNIYRSTPENVDLFTPILFLRWGIIAIHLFIYWHLNSYIIQRFTHSKRVLVLLLVNIGLIVIFLIGESLLIPDKLNHPFRLAPWEIVLKLTIASALFIAFIITLKTTKDYDLLIQENLELQKENYKAQLEALRKQINPHFLFNSLSTLRMMIHSGDNKAEAFVMHLSDVYRQTLQKRDTNIIPLNEELEILNAYIQLIKLRFENSVHIDLKLDKTTQPTSVSIPVFALQLLVENALKHNISSEKKPLQIVVNQPNENTIRVSNGYQPKLSSGPSFGLGLANLSKQYELMNIEDGVHIHRDSSQFAVTLKLIFP